MTESEWLAATEPQSMLAFLRSQPDQHDRLRPLRYSHACCRSVWDSLDPQEQSVAEFLTRLQAEQSDTSPQIVLDWLLDHLGNVLPPVSLLLRMWNLNWWIIPMPLVAMTCRNEFTSADQAALLREIVGNPFQKATFEADWQTSPVLALAKSIGDGNQSHYPILADALLEAGCRDETIIDHCRQSGKHHMHCWVIEGLLKPHADAVGNG